MKYFIVDSEKYLSLGITKEICEKDNTHEKYKTTVL